jgi:hypothetical protein
LSRLFEAPDRRIVVKIIAAALLAPLLRPVRLLAAPLVYLGEDRFSQWTDKGKNTHFIEGLDFAFDQSFIPANVNVFVRGDNIALGGAISMPGSNFTLCARKLICGTGALISTHGKIGSPNFPGGLPAQYATDGTTSGTGFPGGSITILVGDLQGTLQLDSGGGNGGDAQNGGDGGPGSPGAPANHDQDSRPGTAGHIGGRAGTPGNGASGGAILVGAVNGLPNNVITAVAAAGLPGAPALNGKSGHGGQGGAGASGNDPRFGGCGVK